MKKLLLSMAVLALGFTANAGEVVFNFTAADAAETYGLPAYDAEAQDAAYVTVPKTITSGDVTLTLNSETDENGNTGWRMWSDGLREYNKRNPSFTVATTNGENVVYVSWTSNSATFALEGTEENILGWEGSESEVTFVNTTDGNKAVYTITVGYGDYEAGEIPEIPEAPEGTITVSEALTLIANGFTGEVLVGGVVTDITEVSVDYGNATYTICDNADDTEGLLVYRGKYLNGEAFTSEDQLNIGDYVVVEGSLTLYGETPEVATGSKLVSINGETGTPENPDTPETPESGAIFSESFASSLGDFTIENYELPEELSYVWSFAANYGAKASGYYQGNYATESALISPVIDLANYTDVTFSFDHAVNYANGNTVSDYCVVLVLDVEADEWNNVSGQVTYPEGSDWTFVNSGEVSLSAYEGKKIQLGFLYYSTNEVAPTWEIKNLVVDGTEASNGVESIGIDLNAPVEYYNLQGVRVNNPMKGGLYIIRQGNKTQKAIIR